MVHFWFVPEKKDANLCNARSAMKTLLIRADLDPALALAMQYVDFNTLIEFGLFRRNDAKEYFVKKEEDLPLTVENTNFQAEDPDGQMRALALEDAPAGSVPSTPNVRVLLGPLSVPDYDGMLYLQKAKSSKGRGEAEWIETLGNAMEEKYGGEPVWLEGTYDMAIELMDQGALPDVERDPNPDSQRSLAVQRCRKYLANSTVVDDDGTEHRLNMTDAEFKRACHNIARKHGTNESRSKGHMCTHCTKPAPACTHYLVTGDVWWWKPIAELDNEKAKDDVALFCSRRCEEKWQEVLICPDCKTYEYTKTTTGPPSYPHPMDLLDMTAQYHKRLFAAEQAAMMPKKKVVDTDEVAPEKPIKMWPRAPRRISVAICVTCSETMLPRNPMASHLQMTRHLHFY